MNMQMRLSNIFILSLLVFISCTTVSKELSFTVEPEEGKPYIYFQTEEIPGEKWRLWVPEVFIIQNDRDRHFGGIDSVNWQRNGDKVWYEIESWESEEYAAFFKIEISPMGGTLHLQFTVRNVGTVKWGDIAHPALCLSSEDAHRFHHEDGNHTYINVNSSWKSIYQLLDRMPVEKVYNHFLVAGLKDSSDFELRHHVASGDVARENKSQSYTLHFSWEDAARVDVNFNHLHCIHSHPKVGPLEPGGQRTVAGTIKITPGPVHNVGLN